MEKKKAHKKSRSLATARRLVLGQYPRAAQKHKIAVFDFDGTLVDAQSGTEFAKFLFLHHYIGLWTVLRIIWWGTRYTLHLPHDQDAVRKIFIKGLSKRYSKKDVWDMMHAFHQERLVRRYRKAGLKQIQKMKQEGYVCLLASATFEGVADAACFYAGLDGYVATVLEEGPNGRYTGGVIGEVVEGPNKVAAIRQWSDTTFGPNNWEIEYAFGDHHSDRELLSCAKNPVAVNPGQVMKTTAKKRGWPIVEWH